MMFTKKPAVVLGMIVVYGPDITGGTSTCPSMLKAMEAIELEAPRPHTPRHEISPKTKFDRDAAARAAFGPRKARW